MQIFHSKIAFKQNLRIKSFLINVLLLRSYGPSSLLFLNQIPAVDLRKQQGYGEAKK